MAERKRQKITMYCCVPQCKSYFDKNSNVSFHTFPNPKTGKALRAKWIDKLKINKQEVSPFMRVCGKHFRDEDYFFNKRVACKAYRLKKNSVPSVNLPIGTDELNLSDELIQGRSIQREKYRLKITNNVTQMAEEENEPTTLTVLSHQNVHSSVEEDAAKNLLSFSKKEVFSKGKFVDVRIQVNYEDFNQFDVSDIIDTDNKVGNVVSNTTNCKLTFPAIKNEKYENIDHKIQPTIKEEIIIEEFNQNIEETQTCTGINLNKVKEEIKTEIFDDTNIKEEITIEEFNQNIEGTQADTWINLNKLKEEIKTEILDNTTIKKEPLDIEFIEIKPEYIIQ